MITRRNIYAERLLEFPELAFNGECVFEKRGRWREIFAGRIGSGFGGRVIFDVGCADAKSLCEIAAKFPNTAFVGLDWKCKSIHAGASRVTELDLRNVLLLRGRAQDVAKIFGPGEIDEAWVFHPEPCDRPIELKNRLIAEPFLIDVHQALNEPGSALCVKTDHPGYYQWTLGLLGFPEPKWFQPARENRAVQCAPRVKPREIVPLKDVPKPSDAILARFDVAFTSDDFWNDPGAQSETADKCFAGIVTPFERRFARKRLPIYYVELRKK